jgi:Zn-dependent peptidase ImmA (M78 family)
VIETVFDPCDNVVFVVDPDASANEMASVAAGLEMWNERAKTALTRQTAAETSDDVFVNDDVVNDDVVDDDNHAPHVPVHFDPAGDAFFGYYDDEAGEVYINDGFTSDRARTITVAHELGHAFGLFHVDASDRPSLMNEGNTSVALTQEDVAALVALWGECDR